MNAKLLKQNGNQSLVLDRAFSSKELSCWKKKHGKGFHADEIETGRDGYANAVRSFRFEQ